MSEVFLTHEYLVQMGDAERVVAEWVNDFHAASATPDELAMAIRPRMRARGIRVKGMARGFSRDAHVARLGRVIEEVVQRA